MKKVFLANALSLLVAASLNTPAHAQNKSLWTDLERKGLSEKGVEGITHVARKLQVNQTNLEALFADKSVAIQVDIPLPDGRTTTFELIPSSVMAPELAAKFPELMSYKGYQLGNSANQGRFNITPKGLRGRFTIDDKRMYLTPNKEGNGGHFSYFAKDAVRPKHTLKAHDFINTSKALASKGAVVAKAAPARSAKASGDTVRTYRLAISTTAEYTEEFGGVSGTVAELTTLVNRINDVLLKDLSLQFELIGNNDQLIFTDTTTDGFDNDDFGTDIDTNQETIDRIIGSDNYDIGHILTAPTSGGGGLAAVQAACDFRIKATGGTGSSNPRGEEFYIDLVVHEFGHQLGGNHTFNASNAFNCTGSSRTGSSAVEPGSGSTIMAYAGICDPQDLQNDSDPFFHAFSIQQIRDYIDDETPLYGGSCGTLSDPTNALPDAELAATTYTIPANTPFMLTATVTDADDDTLSYIWEQVDPGGSAGATRSISELNSDNGANPLFRSFTPSTSTTRYFPAFQSVLDGSVERGEVYPTQARDLTFEFTVRDGNGGVDREQAIVTIVDTGTAFAVTEPATSAIWEGASEQTITWDVASTDSAPIGCGTVDIVLDTDGSDTFSTELAMATENDGEATITAPDIDTNFARLLVKCSNNVFYAANPGNFNINASPTPTPTPTPTPAPTPTPTPAPTPTPTPSGSDGGGGSLTWLLGLSAVGIIRRYMDNKHRGKNRA